MSVEIIAQYAVPITTMGAISDLYCALKMYTKTYQKCSLDAASYLTVEMNRNRSVSSYLTV